MVLIIKEIEGNYKGENLALVILKVIYKWGIALKLKYIIIDNASNNDTTIDALFISKLSTLYKKLIARC
jgi:hypothetical protein